MLARLVARAPTAVLAVAAAMVPTLPPLHIKGHVYDAATKQPIAGARIGIFFAPPSAARPWDPERLADTVRLDPKIAADGTFDVEVPHQFPAASHVLMAAQAPAHAEWSMGLMAPSRGGVPEAVLGTTDLEVDIPLQAGRTVEIVVDDEAGKPIPDARVELGNHGMSWEETPLLHYADGFPFCWPDAARSDGSGHLTILGSPRFLTVEHEGFAPFPVARLEWYPAKEGIVWAHARMRPGRTLRGTVLDDAGAPVPGARVAAHFERGPLEPGALPVETTTNADDRGRFTLGGLYAQRYSVQVTSPFIVRAETRVDLTHRGDEPLEIRATRGVALRGRILRPDGRPFPHLRLYVGYPPKSWLEESVVTSEDGTFVTNGLKRGTVLLVCEQRISLRRTVDIPSPPLEIRVPPRRELVLELRDRATGEPVKTNGTVGLGTSTQAAWNGTQWWNELNGKDQVSLGLVEEGERYVYASTDEYEAVDTKIHVERGPGRQVFRWQLDKGFVLTGKVSDAAGNPVAGASISATAANRVLTSATSGKDGRFRFANLSDRTAIVGNAYIFIVRAPGFAPALDFDTFARFTILNRSLDFTLTLGGTIRGRVVAPDKKPIRGAVVSAFMKRYLVKVPVPMASAYTDANGQYELKNVPPGTTVVQCLGAEKKLSIDDLGEATADLAVPEPTAK